MISVDSVTRTYGPIIAVDNVSFAVEKGEVVGFVGPNGAGKSTMLKMLATYLLPTAGTLRVDGHDTVTESVEVRRRIGYLPGDTPLYRDMVVAEFLHFVAAVHGLEKAERNRAMDTVIDTCAIAPVLAHRIRECSTGYRQRIGLAAALVHDPPVLLLDEPTHGFDPLQVMAFRDLLTRLKQDRAILFSTHIIADVEAVSDRVLIIHEGRLLGDGPAAKLAKQAGVAGASLEELFAHLVSTSKVTS